MDTQTLTPSPPAHAHPAAPEPEPAVAPDCRSERLWTALSARWLGRCREQNTKETETS